MPARHRRSDRRAGAGPRASGQIPVIAADFGLVQPMAVNTTEHLIADMERLRTHLGIDRW